MEIQELLKSVRNDIQQGAFDKDELLLFCDKVEELINDYDQLGKEFDEYQRSMK